MSLSNGGVSSMNAEKIRAQKKPKKILALLMMPPPIHGASGINEKMLAAFKHAGIGVDVINLVPSRFVRFFDGPIWKALRAIHTFFLMFSVARYLFKKPAAVYFGVSGGFGQVFDCAIAVVVSLLERPVYIHHHSFAYLNNESKIFRTFLRILSGASVFHVVLCCEMQEQLLSKYGDYVSADQIFNLSNVAFFRPDAPAAPKRSLSTLGYVSNITFEKGIVEFIDLIRHCSMTGLPVAGIIAGPCMNPEVDAVVQAALKEIPILSYVGAVYGEKKALFFDSVDLLVFPTRYVNEAEPLIIYEAAEHGIPAVAYGRGCIASMITQCGGSAVAQNESFVENAAAFVGECMDADVYGAKSRRALHGILHLSAEHSAHLDVLLKRMAFS